MFSSPIWTLKTVTELVKLWADTSLGTTEIARRIAKVGQLPAERVTKHAIIGKAHRLGLPSRPDPTKMHGNRPVKLRTAEARAKFGHLPKPGREKTGFPVRADGTKPRAGRPPRVAVRFEDLPAGVRQARRAEELRLIDAAVAAGKVKRISAEDAVAYNVANATGVDVAAPDWVKNQQKRRGMKQKFAARARTSSIWRAKSGASNASLPA